MALRRQHGRQLRSERRVGRVEDDARRAELDALGGRNNRRLQPLPFRPQQRGSPRQRCLLLSGSSKILSLVRMRPHASYETRGQTGAAIALAPFDARQPVSTSSTHDGVGHHHVTDSDAARKGAGASRRSDGRRPYDLQRPAHSLRRTIRTDAHAQQPVRCASRPALPERERPAAGNHPAVDRRHDRRGFPAERC